MDPSRARSILRGWTSGLVDRGSFGYLVFMNLINALDLCLSMGGTSF